MFLLTIVFGARLLLQNRKEWHLRDQLKEAGTHTDEANMGNRITGSLFQRAHSMGIVILDWTWLKNTVREAEKGVEAVA